MLVLKGRGIGLGGYVFYGIHKGMKSNIKMNLKQDASKVNGFLYEIDSCTNSRMQGR